MKFIAFTVKITPLKRLGETEENMNYGMEDKIEFKIEFKMKIILNSTLKCNSMTGCGRCGAAVGFVLYPPSKMRSTNETLQPAHAGTKIHNIFHA